MPNLPTLVGLHCAFFCFAVAYSSPAVAQSLPFSNAEDSTLPESVTPIVGQWLSATDGDWTDSNNWSTNPTFPNNGSPTTADNYDVQIDATGGPYRITLQDDVSVNQITIDSPDAILHHRSQRLEVDDIRIEQGIFELGGTLAGARISGPGTVLASPSTNSPRLENITLGTLLDQTNRSIVRVIGDLTLDNGRWEIGRSGGTLAFDDTTPQSILGVGSISVTDTIQISNQLTVDTGITITSGAQGTTGIIRGGTLINEGVVASETGAFRLDVDSLQNNGTIDVASSLSLGRNDDSTWRNDGTIQLRNGGRLNLGGTFRTQDIGNVVDDGSGQAFITGILDNRGQTLRLNELGFANPVSLNGGTIRGGVLEGQGTSLPAFNISFFDELTLAGELTLGENFTPRIFVENDLMLNDATLTALEGTTLNFIGSEPQLLGGVGTIFAVRRENTSAINTITGRALTIGEDITIRTGDEAYRELRVEFAENRGTIISEAPNTLVTIGVNDDWVNNGTIQVLDGTVELTGTYTAQDIGDLDFQGGTVRLTGTTENEGRVLRQDASTGVWEIRSRLNGGRLETGDGVVANLGGTFTNVTLAGDAELVDQPSIFDDLRVVGSLSFDNGSLRIAESNQLSLSDSVTFSGRGEVLLDGTPETTRIQTFTGTQLLIEEGITIQTGATGGGTISRGDLPVINRGTISARTLGQTLVLNGSLENTGVLEATSASTLQINVDDWQNDGTIRTVFGDIEINGSSFVNGETGVIEGLGVISLESAELINFGIIDPSQLLINGALSLEASSVLDIDVDGISFFDELRVTGDLSLGGLLNVELADGVTVGAGQELVFIEAFGSVTGQFLGLSEGSLVSRTGEHDLRITYAGGDGNDVALFATAVPEPSSLPLVFGILVPMLRRRRPAIKATPK